ncbi:conserved Plasmodium protein, unknown function, partial [Plasmodium malariae]
MSYSPNHIPSHETNYSKRDRRVKFVETFNLCYCAHDTSHIKENANKSSIKNIGSDLIHNLCYNVGNIESKDDNNFKREIEQFQNFLYYSDNKYSFLSKKEPYEHDYILDSVVKDNFYEKREYDTFSNFSTIPKHSKICQLLNNKKIERENFSRQREKVRIKNTLLKNELENNLCSFNKHLLKYCTYQSDSKVKQQKKNKNSSSQSIKKILYGSKQNLHHPEDSKIDLFLNSCNKISSDEKRKILKNLNLNYAKNERKRNVSAPFISNNLKRCEKICPFDKEVTICARENAENNGTKKEGAGCRLNNVLHNKNINILSYDDIDLYRIKRKIKQGYIYLNNEGLMHNYSDNITPYTKYVKDRKLVQKKFTFNREKTIVKRDYNKKHIFHRINNKKASDVGTPTCSLLYSFPNESNLQ